MAIRPIIFSGPMIQAILEGRKTQTRRMVKNVPEAPAMDNIVWVEKKLHPAPYIDAYCGAKRTTENPRGMTEHWAYWTRDDRPGPTFRVGYVPGDRLWVREAWRTMDGLDCFTANEIANNCLAAGYRRPWAPVQYDCDGERINWIRDREPHGWGAQPGRYRHARFMPRWASRITLLVTDVRVQRLQEISEADAEAEGVKPILVPPDGGSSPHIEGFLALWDSLHEKSGDTWDTNPWVAAITFKPIFKNIYKVGK